MSTDDEVQEIVKEAQEVFTECEPLQRVAQAIVAQWRRQAERAKQQKEA